MKSVLSGLLIMLGCCIGCGRVNDDDDDVSDALAYINLYQTTLKQKGIDNVIKFEKNLSNKDYLFLLKKLVNAKIVLAKNNLITEHKIEKNDSSSYDDIISNCVLSFYGNLDRNVDVPVLLVATDIVNICETRTGWANIKSYLNMLKEMDELGALD